MAACWQSNGSLMERDVRSCQKRVYRSFLRRKLQTHPHFSGVPKLPDLFRQKLPRKYLQFFILQNKNHFTSLVIVDRDKCFYFDSCGNEDLGENDDLFNFVESLNLKTLVFNAKPIESSCSNKCGLYCLQFIFKFINTEEKYQNFLNTYNYNTVVALGLTGYDG